MKKGKRRGERADLCLIHSEAALPRLCLWMKASQVAQGGNLAAAHIIQSRNQVDNGTLSGAGRTHNGDAVAAL